MKVIPIKASTGITGFGHGAAEYTEIEQGIDSLVMPNAGATCIVMASGCSMQGVGIFDGDLLIIDRSTRPQEGDVIVASYNREFVCKILVLKTVVCYLRHQNTHRCKLMLVTILALRVLLQVQFYV